MPTLLQWITQVWCIDGGKEISGGDWQLRLLCRKLAKRILAEYQLKAFIFKDATGYQLGVLRFSKLCVGIKSNENKDREYGTHDSLSEVH
ncbi:unnamed protein product [Colias eurytheme]|nr:unnamed protein product [Colias eurytheme]